MSVCVWAAIESGWRRFVARVCHTHYWSMWMVYCVY